MRRTSVKSTLKLVSVVMLLAVAQPALALGPQLSLAEPGIAPPAIEALVAQSWSCAPKKKCSQIRSCEEAYWYLNQCSWGGKLDRDKDGIPCESIC